MINRVCLKGEVKGKTGKSAGRGNCGWAVMYERTNKWHYKIGKMKCKIKLMVLVQFLLLPKCVEVASFGCYEVIINF